MDEYWGTSFWFQLGCQIHCASCAMDGVITTTPPKIVAHIKRNEWSFGISDFEVELMIQTDLLCLFAKAFDWRNGKLFNGRGKLAKMRL